MRLFEIAQRPQKDYLLQSDVFVKALKILKEHNVTSQTFNFAIAPLMNELRNDCDPLFNKINSECGKFISEVFDAETLPFRGSEFIHPIGIFQSKSIESGRRPMSSNDGLTKQLSDAMLAAGIKATRSNSIFISGRYEHANSYGGVNVIFPKNTANFSWAYNEDYHDVILGLSDPSVINNFRDSDLYKKAAELCDPTQWSKLNKVAQPNCGDAHIAFIEFRMQHGEIAKEAGFFEHTFLEFITLNTNKLLKELNIKTTDFAKALTSGGEILVNGEYINIKVPSYMILQYVNPDLPPIPMFPSKKYTNY
jgi:hypothetical protein